jgi:hypothetical protein
MIQEHHVKKQKMKYLLSQPAIKYYAWQLEISIQSLLDNNVQPEDIHIVSGRTDGEIYQGFESLEQKFPGVVFEFYHDNRSERAKTYVPSIRPHINKKHWRKHPELHDEVIFYMEADTLLTKPINKSIYKKPGTWYLSDTKSYIGHDYIVSKDQRFLDLFCGIVKIDPEVVKANQEGSGGAQYIMKGLTEKYWEKVEKDCVEIYIQGKKLNQEIKAKNPDWHELQIWTACMWAHLWNGWLLGYETKCPKSLNFTWATDPIENIQKNRIYHNAGATTNHKNLFLKSDFIDKFPYQKKLKIDKTKSSFFYWQKIKEMSKQTFLKD